MLLAQSSPSLQEKQSGGRMQLAMISRSFRSRRQFICAHATEVFDPILRLASRCFTGTSTPPLEWRKGLLIGANHIGDILYRTSSLMQLAKGFPSCTWDILAPEPAAQVLENNPAIRKIHRMEIPYYGSEDFMTLKTEKYDVAICYDTGMYTQPLLTATLLGIPNRVGYVHKGWSGLVTHPIRINYPQPFPAYFRDLVAQLTEQEINWDLRPKVTLTDQDHRKAEALCPNSSWQMIARYWPVLSRRANRLVYGRSRSSVRPWSYSTVLALLRSCSAALLRTQRS
jgi:hypothetical protein